MVALSIPARSHPLEVPGRTLDVSRRAGQHLQPRRQPPVKQTTFKPPEVKGERLLESERQSVDELADRLKG
jgi:hypothetical protein